MKLKSQFALLFGGILLLASCGGGTGENGENAEEGEVSEQKIMTPMNAADFEPIAAKDLYDTWTAWQGKKVQVTGYLDLFFDKEALSFQSAKLVGKPGDKTILLEAELSEKDSREYERSVAVTIEGTLDGTWGYDGKYYAKLTDAKIIKNGAEMPMEKELDPAHLKGPISAQALYDNYVAWLGKEITVVGNANGVTTSTTSMGVTVRVDLTAPGSAFEKYCGVEVRDASHAKSAGDAPNKERKYRGIFTGDCFSQVCIEEAVEVK